MKSVKSLFHSLLGLCLVTSCVESNDVIDVNVLPSQSITIEASQEGRKVETRTTLQSDGSVFWNPNDEISLFFNSGKNGGYKFISQNSENVAIAEFAGNIYGITGGGENLDESAYFWATYPYSESNSCDGESITVTIPNKQQAVEGTFADDLFVTVARSQSVKMAFKNVCGGVKFCVTNSDIESVVFRGNDNETLAGCVRVAFDSGNKPVVAEVVEGQTEVVVTAPNGGTFEPGKYYYLIALPTPLESGFTMTFKKSDDTCIVYNRTSSVTINRSRFGVVENLDTGEAVPDEDTPAGGSESGFYLGIIGFNNGLYTYPIKHLSAKSVAGYNSFIDGLSTQNGTLLYYAVDRSIDQLQAATFPSNLYNVSIVTFTDGLDQGSLDEGEGNYLTNAEYLTALNKSLTEEKVSDNSITAYTIGVLGDDASANYNAFRNNLEKLATSSDNVFEVNDMSEVNEAFMEIASQLGETKYYQTFMLEIKGPSHNEKCRFTFDNVSSYDASQCYIEGTFNRVDKTLTDVSYVGLTSTSGTVVSSVKTPDNFYVFTFEGLQTSDEGLVPKDCVQHWYTNEGVWQKNSEFVFDPGSVTMEKIERSAAVLLNLDCSSSLGEEDFATLKQSAKSFITKLRENVADPYTAESISLNKQSVTLSIGMTETLIATVLPDTAVQKDVEWNSTNSTVASVDKNGKITAHELGTTTIMAKTIDGELAATCRVNVVSDENMIFYTSTDGKIVTPYKTDVFGANIVSNTYVDGVGTILFDDCITSVGFNAFYNCKTLSTIKLSDKVTSIGEYAFSGCTSLSGFNFSSGIKSIATLAFENCTAIKTLTIPDNITSIAAGAFTGCKFTSATLGNGLETISSGLFSGMTSLEIVNFGTAHKIIGSKAFYNCSSLRITEMPASVTTIEPDAFYGCKAISYLTLPEGLVSIGSSAFASCTGLVNVTLPSTVTTIGASAFADCTKLAVVYCNPTTPPTIGTNVFAKHASDFVIYVPKDSIASYCSTINWGVYNIYITNTGGSVPGGALITLRVGDLVYNSGGIGVVFHVDDSVVKVMSVGETSESWSSAKSWCSNYGVNWYLPSEGELREIYNNKSIINSTLSANGYTTLGTGWYWSSTELNDDNAYELNFSLGNSDYSKKRYYRDVRAVLAF